jgi:hypothetical protein
MTHSTTTISSAELKRSVDLIDIKPGLKFSLTTLRQLLPDVVTLLFFGKVYELDYIQLSALMSKVLKSDLAAELFGGYHSLDLQDYLVGCEDEWGNWHEGIVPAVQSGNVTLKPDVPHGEILPEVWKQLEVEVAASIKAVAEKLESVVGLLPGKAGAMTFGSLMQMNAKRPIIGDYKARITHAPQQRNLIILDDSGSMTYETVRTIISDVVALAYMANADMALVSNTCRYWEAGTFDVDTVMATAQFGGTHYETLAPLFDRDWGTVITVADYDSSLDAKRSLAANCYGRIEQVLDISLVNRPTFLADCVGQLASKVTPLLVGNSTQVLCS